MKSPDFFSKARDASRSGFSPKTVFRHRMAPVVLYLCLPAFLAAADDFSFIPKIEGTLEEGLRLCREKGIVPYDLHIHRRGGMDATKAAMRQVATGIRSGILENLGREWPLYDAATLREHIEAAEAVRATGVELLIGVQVNDRDWHETIDPELHRRLDFVLADTMIMGTDREGRPCRLWMEDRYDIEDVDAWMERYMKHNLQVLSEPITILANPTYLPKRIADRYERLWTRERMEKIIDKAIIAGIALEIQAESEFPHRTFLKLAKEKGARFSLGTNNHDARPKDLSRWFQVIKELDLTAGDFIYLPE